MKKLLFCCLVMLLVSTTQVLAETSVHGRYLSAQGKKVQVQLTVSQPPPAAFIVLQRIPAGVQLLSADPEPSGFDKGSSAVKWLFKGPHPGSLRITMHLSQPVAAHSVSGEIRYRDPGSGKMMTRRIK